MNKAKLIEEILSERQQLEETLAKIEPGRMTAPELDGGWSVKDTLAHIVVWEQNMVTWLKVALQGEEPHMLPPGFSSWEQIDEINAMYYQQNCDKPLAQVLDEFQASYEQTLEAVRNAPEPDLFEPLRYPWRKGEPLWHIVEANTSGHYQEHRLALQAWIEVQA